MNSEPWETRVILESNLRESLHTQAADREFPACSFQVRNLRQIRSDKTMTARFA